MKMKRVDPKVYTKSYFLSDCSGYHEFRNAGGKVLEARLKRAVKDIKIRPGFRVLDIGCGRGEMVYWAANAGAVEAVGIDYSSAAIDIADSARKKWSGEIRKKTRFLKMDAKNLKFPNKYFDLIIMSEIVEHLYNEELIMVLGESKRILRDNGTLYIHTAPNKLFNDIAYPIWCYPASTVITGIYNLVFGKNYSNIGKPGTIRTKYHHIMHVNEPTFFSLTKLFKKTGFTGTIYSTNITINKPVLSWKDALFNFLVYLYPISRYFPFSVLWGNDFYVNLKKV